jgi:hypothetical protein
MRGFTVESVVPTHLIETAPYINKRCEFCRTNQNRANFKLGRCHNCYKELVQASEALNLPVQEEADRICHHCDEIKPKSSFKPRREGRCDPCWQIEKGRKLKVRNDMRYFKAENPMEGFSAMMASWLRRSWL